MAVNTFQLRIPDEEYRARCAHLQGVLAAKNLSGIVLFDGDYIKYYTGFAFVPTERPMAFVMNQDGERGLFVPRLEKEHAEANAIVEHVVHYPEYPGETHPMHVLSVLMNTLNVKDSFGVDTDGYPWIMGYRGPSLSELLGASVTPLRAEIEDQMMIKSPAEIALMYESIRWANLAHVLLQRYTAVGVTETQASERAEREATHAMLDALGPIYRAQGAFYRGAVAGYRGQIGRNSAIPHALAGNITFQAGDVLVTGASAPVWGYVSELERTMFVGEPTDEQRTYFDHMMNVQEIAFEALQPGNPCAQVDRAVRNYYEKNDLMPYWKHHTGHAIGLRYHEGPFLDIGDNTVIKPGMIFTVEPGLYVPNLGGFRHSDTVLVTESGLEIMTYYPRQAEALIIPV